MKAKDLVLLSLLTAILFVGQVALAFLPNIEVVSLLIIVYTLVFRKKVFYVIYAFALLEGIVYGFGLWWVMYLYVWTILALVILLFKHNNSLIIWVIISGGFGLLFGTLCSIPYFIIGGWGLGFSYWIQGLPFDILHGLGNMVVTLLLFNPCYKALKTYNKMSIV